MIRSILVCTDGSAHGDSACDYAIHLAHKLQAQLECLHVLDSRTLEGPLMSDLSGWLGASPYAAQLGAFRLMLENKGRAILESFDRKAKEADVPASARMVLGHPARAIPEAAASAELIVMGRRGEHADLDRDVVGTTAERTVRQSERPVMLVPKNFIPPRKILVAYDGSNHGSKALHEAIELAQALEVPMVVLCVSEHHNREAAQEYAQTAMRLVRAHECTAAPMVAEGPAGATILRVAEEIGASLIVAGAFGHSRVHELILGSTSSFLMSRSNKPVMLVR